MYVCGRTNFGQSPIRSVIWQKLMTGVRQGFVLSCYLLSDAWCSDRDLFRSNHLTVGPPLYSTVTFTSYLQKLNHPYHLIESRFVSPNKVIGLRLTRSGRHFEQFFACLFVENSYSLQRFSLTMIFQKIVSEYTSDTNRNTDMSSSISIFFTPLSMCPFIPNSNTEFISSLDKDVDKALVLLDDMTFIKVCVQCNYKEVVN